MILLTVNFYTGGGLRLRRPPFLPVLCGAGWSSPVARQAHNLKVAGSNPAPATKLMPSGQRLGGILLLRSVLQRNARRTRKMSKAYEDSRRFLRHGCDAEWRRIPLLFFPIRRVRPAATNAKGLRKLSEAKTMPWMVALAFYFAIGLALVFVGPTARMLRREREKLAWQTYDQPRWKLVAFSGAIAVGIILLWPVLVVSAARTESASKIDLLVPRSVEPSVELDRWVSEVQKRYANSLPFEAYREIVGKLPWTDYEHFDKQLAQLGCTITGYAKGPEGQDFAVAVPVLKVGMPFTLTRLRGSIDSLPIPRKLAQNEISLDRSEEHTSEL